MGVEALTVTKPLVLLSEGFMDPVTRDTTSTSETSW